jgi:glycosyltransferase involved in cell wall biosynthesis
MVLRASMHILFLTSTFSPTIGGAETYALMLARGLGALGHTVEVATDMVPGAPDSEILAKNVRVRRLHRYRTQLVAADTIFWEQMQFGLRPELLEAALVLKPDIVMSNSLDLCVPAKLVSITTGAPWVATFHEQAPEREAMGAATLRLSYDLLQPDAVIAGSRFYLDRARRFAREDRCHLIYHGIDPDLFSPRNTSREVRRRYGIPEDYALVVSAGRLKERKGFHDLIRSIGKLVVLERKMSVIIAGTLNSASARYLEDLHSEVKCMGLEHLVSGVNYLVRSASIILAGDWTLLFVLGFSS